MAAIEAPDIRAPSGLPTTRVATLRQAAQELEATFLAEMLKSAGMGQSRDALGGGIGEDQFGSFLVGAQARAMVKAGGIGLAESIFKALMEAENGD
jgi:Rod binding domain-containing protein